MNRTEFLSILTEWQNLLLRTTGIARSYNNELYAAACSKPIKIITGFRRCGKSFLLQMVANQLVNTNKYALTNILYLNFEDYRLSHINQAKDLDELVQLFLREVAAPGKKLLIFDEIQQVENWDKLIRTLYEKQQDIEIFLTGSNSELLSAEIGSNLAGRFIEFKIDPFSFQEFLLYHKISITTEKDYFKNIDLIKQKFSEYLTFGGLPEVFTISDNKAKLSYLQGIISKVILDDIIQRFKVRQPLLIEKILHYLLTSIGNLVSVTRMANLINEDGLKIKPETVTLYIDYIRKTFAISELNKFDWKLNRLFNTTKKYYAVDTGLINLFDSTTSSYAKQLENIVFLKLKRDFDSVYFGSIGNKEIDFVVKIKEKTFRKYQVTLVLSAENKQRELAAFESPDKYLEGNILLTLSEDENTLEINGNSIQQRNLIRWLLDIPPP